MTSQENQTSQDICANIIDYHNNKGTSEEFIKGINQLIQDIKNVKAINGDLQIVGESNED